MKTKSHGRVQALALSRLHNFRTSLNAIREEEYRKPFDGITLNTITAINAAIMGEGNFRQGLTSFAVGWKDEEGVLDADLDFFLPSVEIAPTPGSTGQLFEYEQADNAAAFVSDDSSDDLRAPRGEFKSVDIRTTKEVGRCQERGLQIIVDQREVDLRGAEYYVGRLMRRLKRNKLRRGIAALSTGAANTAATWDTTAGCDPDAQITGDLVTAAGASGVRPNRVGYGATAWQKRWLALRGQTAPALANSAGMSPEQLRQLMMLEGLHVSETRYSSAASTRAEVVNNLVIAFTALKDATPEDPSNIKDFWSKTTQGTRYAVYEWEVAPSRRGFAVSHWEDIILTSSLGLRKRTIS
jgi:hypothetical protein